MRLAPSWTRQSHGAGARVHDDGGFSLVEAIVAIALIGTVMAALAPFLVNSLNLVAQQRGKQTAIRVAGDGIERARALKASALLAGRGRIRTTQQWNTAADPVRPYLATMQLAWDPLLPADSDDGVQAPLPTEPNAVSINGVSYSQSWYIGRCRQQAATAVDNDCDNPDSPDPDPGNADVPFFQLVVAVTWTHRSCPSQQCVHIASTLVSPVADSTFNLNRPPPTVNKPGNRLSYLSTTVSVQLTATGGQLPLTWTASGLPAGLSVSTSGLITGTPTTVGTSTVTITATDRKSDTDSAQFTWSIAAPPALTNPGDQLSATGTALSLAITATGGAAPLTWSATGLPTGLAISTSTGVISGTPTTVQTATVTVTVTDQGKKTAAVTLTWRVFTPLQVQNPGTQNTAMGGTVGGPTLTASGGTPPYTWRATDLPDGLSIDASTAKISGTTSAGTRYLVRVSVTDSAGVTASSTFVWNVPPAKNNDLQVTAPDPAGPDQVSTAGQAITTLTAKAFGGGSSGYTWSVKNLPPGLTMSASGFYDAKISGTPTTPGAYTVRLSVVDGGKKSAHLMFLWTVK